MKTKTEFRQEVLAWRNRLDPDTIEDWSREITRLFFSLPEVAGAQVIFGYLSFRQEVRADGILAHLLHQGKTVAVPATNPRDKTMVAGRIVSLTEGLTLTPMGIREPVLVDPVPPECIDLVLVPGVAFDQQGFRLGYGGGYYDRFLANLGHRAVLAGVAYEKQVVARLPREPHDQPVDLVITEKRIHRFPCGS